MKKDLLFSFALLVVAFSSLFVSCDEGEFEQETNTCTLTVISKGGGSAKIVDYDETSMTLVKGNEVTVVATPYDNCCFVGWFVDDVEEPVSTDIKYKFIVNENVTLTAKFDHAVISISRVVYGCASFKDSPDTSIVVLSGTEVTVVATPNEHCEFIGWYVGDAEDPVSTDAVYTFTVNEDVTFAAKFVPAPIDGYDWVDLGLPSGIKWATYNVGAAKPEEYGGYYAWGETEEKDNYEWSTYKWCNGSNYTLTKYCTNSGYGTVDNKTFLDPDDDVARVKWSDKWRMPTCEEQEELRNSCTWQWVVLNGVNGYKVTGSNGESIFLPAAGVRYYTEVNGIGSYCHFWSGSLTNSGCDVACYLLLSYGSDNRSGGPRYYGQSVRPVSE